MKTIFLDRDGVINKDHGYVYKWENFDFIPGSLKALQILTKYNYKIIIVTNQAGIARGYYTENDFKILTDQFNNFCKNNNITILDTLYCPHHKDGKIKEYIKDCECRKPSPGMFYKASKIHKINLNESIMVGDNFTDLIASSKAGITKNFLVNKNHNFKKINIRLLFTFKYDLISVIRNICN